MAERYAMTHQLHPLIRSDTGGPCVQDDAWIVALSASQPVLCACAHQKGTQVDSRSTWQVGLAQHALVRDL